jgi:hypothetical protein
MIEHRIRVAGLGVGAADLPLDLAETGLDLPPGGAGRIRIVGGHRFFLVTDRRGL